MEGSALEAIDPGVRLLLELKSLSQNGHFVLPVSDLQGSLEELTPILVARVGDTIHRHPAVKLWYDVTRGGVQVPSVFRFYYQPLDKEHGCTCPGGEAWHQMSQKLGYGPRPVQPSAAGRLFQRNFDCRWCIHLASYWPKRYDWLWRHVNASSLTILGHSPPAIEVSFQRDRRSIKFALGNLHTNLSTVGTAVVRKIMAGERVDPDFAKGALRELYGTRRHLKMELMDYYAWNSEPSPFTKQEDVGIRALIAATECASFDPRWLTSRGCMRLPIVPTWVRASQDWRLTGHFMVAREDASAWYNWMTPLGIVELTDTP